MAETYADQHGRLIRAGQPFLKRVRQEEDGVHIVFEDETGEYEVFVPGMTWLELPFHKEAKPDA